MCGLCTFLSPLRVSSFFFSLSSVAPLISNELAVSDSLKFLLSAVAFFLCSWGNIVLFFFRTHFSYFGFDSLLFYLYYSLVFTPNSLPVSCAFFCRDSGEINYTRNVTRPFDPVFVYFTWLDVSHMPVATPVLMSLQIGFNSESFMARVLDFSWKPVLVLKEKLLGQRHRSFRLFPYFRG